MAHIFSPDVLNIIIKAIYAAALCYGCISDIKSLKIPNSVSGVVLVLFFVNYWLMDPQESIKQHIAVGGGAFVLTFALYALGYMGAGDVKLISALMLWAGPKDGLTFLVIMTMVGGLLAALLLIARKSMALWPSTYHYIPSRRLKSWAKLGIFPYGIAICTAGLILMPAFFARH